jgi:hypothetical protein
MPALAYAFIFNSLLIGARRRVHREFVARAELAKLALHGEVAGSAALSN